MTPTPEQGARTSLDMALIRLVGEGYRPRCAEYAGEGESPWLSDDHAERAVAAKWCAGCAVITECHAAATEGKETFGVWGGADFTKQSKRKS